MNMMDMIPKRVSRSWGVEVNYSLSSCHSFSLLFLALGQSLAGYGIFDTNGYSGFRYSSHTVIRYFYSGYAHA